MKRAGVRVSCRNNPSSFTEAVTLDVREALQDKGNPKKRKLLAASLPSLKKYRQQRIVCQDIDPRKKGPTSASYFKQT